MRRRLRLLPCSTEPVKGAWLHVVPATTFAIMNTPLRFLPETSLPWLRVVFSADCDEDGNCPQCTIDYADCGCPGPTQEDDYEYREDADGVLWARRLAG